MLIKAIKWFYNADHKEARQKLKRMDRKHVDYIKNIYLNRNKIIMEK